MLPLVFTTIPIIVGIVGFCGELLTLVDFSRKGTASPR